MSDEVKGVTPPDWAAVNERGMPGSPAFVNRNIPEPEDVVALAQDKERLKSFLAGGYRLWRRANSRTWEGAPASLTKADGTEDPSFGQKSNLDARAEMLRSMDWFWVYGPTLLLVLDEGLERAVQRAYQEAQAEPAKP